MPPTSEPRADVTQLLQEVKQGDHAAFEQIWQLYFEKLVQLARRNLNSMPSAFADENDVVQSVMFSWYQRVIDGRFPNLNDRHGLWKLLLTITLNKSRALARKEGNRQALLKERYVSGLPAGDEPTLESVTQFTDQFRALLAELDDDLLRTIAVDKMYGLTNREIAAKTGKAMVTVERKLGRIRKIWAASLAED
jgi:DNA-directed RNA polymerase specialized sigma24 family protein